MDRYIIVTKPDHQHWHLLSQGLDNCKVTDAELASELESLDRSSVLGRAVSLSTHLKELKAFGKILGPFEHMYAYKCERLKDSQGSSSTSIYLFLYEDKNPFRVFFKE